MSTDYYKDKAESYGEDRGRAATRHLIADSILQRVMHDADMHLMDFGSGTGMLLERIAPQVAKITAVDISTAMNEQLRKKQADIACKIDVLNMDLCTNTLDQTFDGIISSMTMHHIEDVSALFATFYSLLHAEGFIAIADLETEDGRFHTEEDTGVFHCGFSHDELMRFASNAGFKNARVELATTISKEQGDYPVLLLTAIK